MQCKIEFYYDTGNSFGRSPGHSGFLETSGYPSHVIEWTDLEEAKLTLARMKEHYEFATELSSYRHKNAKKPIWLDQQKNDFDYQISFNSICDGKPINCSSSEYCGYFERLKGAQIVINDDNLSFEL